MGVSGWMFLLVPAYPGCPGSKAVKRSLLPCGQAMLTVPSFGCRGFASVGPLGMRYRLTVATTRHPAALHTAVWHWTANTTSVTLLADVWSWTEIRFNWGTIMRLSLLRQLSLPSTSTQPCIPPGSLNRVPASAGVKAGMSPLPGGR